MHRPYTRIESVSRELSNDVKSVRKGCRAEDVEQEGKRETGGVSDKVHEQSRVFD
jgi:hypothetical protein